MPVPAELARAYASGDFIGATLEYLPGDSGTIGTPVTITDFIPALDAKWDPDYDMLDAYVMINSPDANAILERARLQSKGTAHWYNNPTMGTPYITASLGAETTLSAVAATVTTASNTTSNGKTHITVAGSFTVGAWVLIDTDNTGVATANTLPRRVLADVTGVLTVEALPAPLDTASSGIYVTQPAQDKIATSLLPVGFGGSLPTLTVERNYGGKWALRFPGVFIEKLEITFGKDSIEALATCYGTAKPLHCDPTGTAPYEAVMTAFTPTADDLAAALRPFTSIDGLFAIPGDPAGTGTSALRAAVGVKTSKITIDTNLIKESVYGNDTYLAAPGDKRQCMVEYVELDTALRLDVFQDYITPSIGVPFFAGAAKNVGTASLPVFKASGAYIPNLRFQKDNVDKKIGAFGEQTKSGKATLVPGLPQDKCQVFILK